MIMIIILIKIMKMKMIMVMNWKKKMYSMLVITLLFLFLLVVFREHFMSSPSSHLYGMEVLGESKDLGEIEMKMPKINPT